MALSIDGNSAESSLNTALQTCEYYRLDFAEAMQIINEIRIVRSSWEHIARKASIIEFEINAMKEIFDNECD